MHGQGYHGNKSDPTHPSFLGAIPQRVGTGYDRGAAIGTTRNDGEPQYPYYATPQNGNNFYPGSGYPGTVPQARTGGLIGELPYGSGQRGYQVPPNYGQRYNQPLLGYGEQTQRVAKLRIGGNDAAGSSSQLSVYRNETPVYAQASAVNQWAGHPELEQRASMPHMGAEQRTSMAPAGLEHRISMGSTVHPESPYQRSKAGDSPVAQHMGSKTGQPSQAAQPKVGRMPSGNVSLASGHAGSFASGQIPSAFVPASTSQPIVGGAASQYSMPIGPEESAQSLSALSAMDSISNLGSVSQLGSMSQMGSIGIPSANVSNAQSSGAVIQNRSTSNLSNRVKAVCSSGGHFMKVPGGGLEYQGGETRLIQVPNFCRYSELLEALERLAGTAAGPDSASSSSNPSIKYQLPSEPNMYVDLVDDEDAQLMFEDWHDYSLTGKSAAAKLHLFVDWLKGSDQSLDVKQAGAEGSLESLERRSLGRSDSAGFAGQSAGSGRAVRQSSSAEGVEPSQVRRSTFDYNDIAERMEVIHPKDVSLVKFLGSGGYGEVYLGKWHSSEAAIKCLNPSLFFNEGQVSEVAIAELIREADLLGCLRHPNVVWVYGIVLPDLNKDSSDEGSDADSEAANVPASAAQQQGKGSVPGSVRPPAIVTEFMSQGSLKGALQRKADICQGALMRVLIAMDAAKGMEYLHQKRIVHFDLKSANLLLGWRDRRAICKVADFGLSKQRRETYVSNVSSQRGTLPWIAPEIIKSPHAVNEKVDVFSFGVVLWELWTGKEPYDGLNYHALLHQITTSDSILRPALPGSPDWDPSVGPEPVPGYRGLMERCWEESPAGRPSFSQIVKALKDMATALRPRKPRPSNASSALPRTSSTQPQSKAGPQADVQASHKPSESRAEQPSQAPTPPQDSSAAHIQAGPASSPRAASTDVKSPGGAMSNPFAAQSQSTPIEGQVASPKALGEDASSAKQAASTPEDQQDHTGGAIGTALASAATPESLANPFAAKAHSQVPSKSGSSTAAAEGLHRDDLSIGTNLGPESVSSKGRSAQPSPGTSAPPSTAAEEGRQATRGSSTSSMEAPVQAHSPAVSAFGAIAQSPRE